MIDAIVLIEREVNVSINKQDVSTGSGEIHSLFWGKSPFLSY